MFSQFRSPMICPWMDLLSHQDRAHATSVRPLLASGVCVLRLAPFLVNMNASVGSLIGSASRLSPLATGQRQWPAPWLTRRMRKRSGASPSRWWPATRGGPESADSEEGRQYAQTWVASGTASCAASWPANCEANERAGRPRPSEPASSGQRTGWDHACAAEPSVSRPPRWPATAVRRLHGRALLHRAPSGAECTSGIAVWSIAGSVGAAE